MKNALSAASIAIVGLILVAATAANSITPPAYEQTAIVDEVRAGLSPGTTFVVGHLRVATQGDASIAYVEIRPQAVDAVGIFSGWAMLRRPRESARWRLMFAVDSIGVDDCPTVRQVYATAIETARLYGANGDIFSRSFFEARNAVDRSSGKMCNGEVRVEED